ncbi:TPA: hypothetical protein ACNOH1_000142 [Providencia rettgeri]
MLTLHGFTCKILNFPSRAPALARPEALYAPALKGPPEADRRGGGEHCAPTTIRENKNEWPCYQIISTQKLV